MIYFSDGAEEDYRYYLRWYEAQQDSGNESWYIDPMTLAAWFDTQSAEYRALHAHYYP